MHASTRAFIKRGGAACAAAAILLGSSLTVATAAPTPEPTSAPVTAEAPAATPDSTLPSGLADAVAKDLGVSVAEFNAAGESASTAAQAHTTAATADAASVDALFNAYLAEFGASQLQSIMVNGHGEFIIRTGDAATSGPALKTHSFMAAAQPSVHEFAAKYKNVKVEEASGPATAFAGEVTNGQGILSINEAFTRAGTCSIGWNGFDKNGAPAVITAGHCTHDDEMKHVVLSDPEFDPAVTGDPGSGQGSSLLGTFGASQFGGPNNTFATAPPNWQGDNNLLNNIGTDVAVVDNITPDLKQLATVTDWTTPADPKASGPKVTGVSNAVIGAAICKSGRTTGWTCGEVTEIGVFVVRGISYPADPDICSDDPMTAGCDDLRAVRGFGSTSLRSAPGDSGGPIISGQLAVGMVSGGIADKITYGVSLTDALKHTDGYTVKIVLAAPQITTDASVYREGTITGTVAGAPAGTTVVVTLDGVTSEVVVGQDGEWSVKAPDKFGTFSVTAHAKNGFNTSEATEASVEVIKETLPAPVITAPANDAKFAAPVTTIAGTGTPGATVSLTGDVDGSVEVAASGEWSFTITPGLALGQYTVTAAQALLDWNDSASVTAAFTVAPNGPAITSPANGQEFAFDAGPSVISGTTDEGATVEVTINGVTHRAVVVDGSWSVTLDERLATGAYAVTAAQYFGDFASLSSTSAFTVLAQPQPEPTTPPATQKPQEPQEPQPTKAPSKDHNLAKTGASSSMLILGGAGGVLLLTGSVFLLIRRRNAA